MFVGCSSFNAPIVEWGSPTNLLNAMAPYSKAAPKSIWKSDHQLLAKVSTTTGATRAEIFTHIAAGVVVSFWGRLDNRAVLCAKLQLSNFVIDEEIIASAWLQWGVHCPEHITGDFTFAIMCQKTHVVFLARDRMGAKPLFYRLDAEGFCFASSASAFHAFERGELTRSDAWMARFLLYSSNSHTETAYDEVKKLAAAHYLLLQADGAVTIRRYHQFCLDAERAKTRDPMALEAYRDIWKQSIRNRIPKSGIVACENSGGIDSGSITAEVALQMQDELNRLHCFGFARYPLEPSAIMATAIRYGIHNTFISSRQSDYHYLPEVLNRSLAVNGYPIEMGVAEDHDVFYQMAAKQGAEVLFSGFGGDELLTSQNHEAREEYIDHREFGQLMRSMPGHRWRRLDRALRYYWRDRCDRNYPNLSREAFSSRWDWTFFTAEAEATFNLREAFIGANDYALEYRDVNTLALAEINLPHVPVRMENCTIMATSYGMDYVYPLLDAQLIQQWFSTPTLWKMGDGGMMRYLHRSAIAGVCPDSITWKRSKDMGGVGNRALYEVQSNRHHFQQLLDSAEAMPSSMRSIIDVNRLQTLARNGLQNDVSGYETFSAMIMLNWTLQALVKWVNQCK